MFDEKNRSGKSRETVSLNSSHNYPCLAPTPPPPTAPIVGARNSLPSAPHNLKLFFNERSEPPTMAGAG
jgi:hypothetical protein